MPTQIRAQPQWSKSEAKVWGIVLFLGTLVAYACRVSLPICAVAVARDYKWTKQETGTVLSSFFWGYATTQILGGWLADKISGEILLGFTSVGWATVTFIFPFLIDFSYWFGHPLKALVLFRVFMGATQGVHFPCLASLTARHLSGSERSRMLGILMAGSHAGTVLCGSVGSVIMDVYGWTSVFYFLGLISIIWWCYLRYLTRHPRRRPKLVSISSAPGSKNYDVDLILNQAVEPSVVIPLHSQNDSLHSEVTGKFIRNGSVIPISHSGDSVPWMKLFSCVPFWAAVVAHYCGANAFFTLFSWMPTYFAETFPDAEGWVFNFIPNLAIVLTSSISPVIASNLIAQGYSVTSVRKLMECLSQVGIALMLFCVAAVDSYEASLFCMTMALALRGLHHAGVAVNAQDFAPNHAGSVFGFVNTASAIPGFVGVYIAGFILDLTHSWAYVFSLTSCLCLFGALVFALFGTGKQLI